MSLSKHKLVRAISAEELDTFLEDLAGMADVTGQKIRDLAEDRFGVEMGHSAANNFRTEVFGAYLEKLRARRERTKLITQIRDEDTGRMIADAASEELQQQVFEFMMSTNLDLNKAEDLERAESLAKIIASARREDRKLIKELERKLEQAEEKEKQTAKAVVAAAQEKGASPQLVEAIRTAMNFRPQPAKADPAPAGGNAP